MPALKPTQFEARITWIGLVEDRSAALASRAVTHAHLDFGGIIGESHGGLTRASCARVTSQHAKGTEIKNTRQLTILSAEELAIVAEKMGVEALDPSLIGASLVIEGIPDFTHIPPSSRLQGPSGACLIVDMENRPCHVPAKTIDAAHGGFGRAFKTAAKGLRGVTASVERPGQLNVGDALRLHVPDQPVWAHLDAARS